MAETVNLLQKIQQRITEKDEVIEEQMTQIADLEDELETLKEEFAKIKEQLDSMLNQ